MRDIKKLVKEMTLEEKAGMCSGLDFWHLKGVDRLGIPSVMVTDGPHGLRKQAEEADHLGINDSIKAVCFPAACATACSFDRDLLYKLGEVLGEECQAENVSVLLGPAVNIKRSPLCGRNFEYFSEDPYLTSQLARDYIKGVQSKHVGTSIKHFAANNQEYRRMSCSSEVDERTLREIYLSSFETAIKEGKPYTVMCSYNRLNGEYASENSKLLTEILRDEWGYEGYVVSDWGAVNDRVEALKAGLELEMPSSNGETDLEIIKAIKEGSLEEDILDRAVERILKIIFNFVDHRTDETLELEEHHKFATKVEEESMVLLKNEGVLPLKEEEKVAFIGAFAKSPRYQGGGSSHINSFKVSNAFERAKEISNQVSYAQGYHVDDEKVDEELLKEAVQLAERSDKAVLFIGLPDSFESEGYDRSHLEIPYSQQILIKEVAKVQKDIIVVLHNGSPIEMPWISDVKGILEAYLGGQAVGIATANILYGKKNPCGKLAETFPIKLEDNPSYLNFPGDGKTVEYKEGVFVGYRYYEKKKMNVLFPFGYGLSYTTFEYRDLKLSKKELTDEDVLNVSVTIENTGNVAGKEIVQLYVKDHTNSIMRPKKELRNFDKVELQPGESKTITMELSKRDLSYYNVELKDWYASSGEYEILIGKSSAEIVLQDRIVFTTEVEIPFQVTRNTPLEDILNNEKTKKILKPMVDEIQYVLGGDSETAKESVSEEMALSMVGNMPLRGLRSFAGKSSEELDRLVQNLNEVLRK
ncbi:MAG TPA: glycoside hydrolase family 3 C-terminal domain-containing protein [Candidatus Merdenecus merdavium]|nr:glycoside hydrolase family 3 C-terminal domain-containing protein [Candidatus Merdenecus merdavium]